MTTFLIIFMIIFIWLICSVLTYPRIKKAITYQTGLWTTNDRRMVIALSLLGPLALVISFVVDGVHPDRGDKPAKW
jgi:hypothetical protein